ncbi:MAG TPA: hypothetical protein VGQ95_08810 [Chthoniobacterales bacterium]|nr:hypothetical protein [Chthoniobacterales bacterium]
MTYVKLIVDLIAAIAWPGAILTIALIYRKPIYSILHHMGGIAGRAATEAAKLSVGNFKVEFEDAVATKNPQSIDEAIKAAADVAQSFIPEAIPIEGKPGFFKSPYAPSAGLIDARGLPPRIEIKDPFTKKTLLLPR